MHRFVWPYRLLVVVCCWLTGCGMNAQTNYAKLRPKLLRHDYPNAVQYLESTKESFYGKDNRLLYDMDRGMVLHLAERYQESNQALEKAKIAADALWTESVGANAAAWLTTDNALPYQGEDFEKVLLHFVAALNYMQMHNLSDARVEARQITNTLERYQAKYDDPHNTYNDDAFARWLAGRLAQTDTEITACNDAWLDYRRALSLYESYGVTRYRTPTPRRLVVDAMQSLQCLGKDFQADLKKLQTTYPDLQALSAKQNKHLGHVVFLHLSGEAPYKRDSFWTAVVGLSVLRIAFPVFVAKPHRIIAAHMTAKSSGESVWTEKMQDIEAIAIQNLADHMGRIKTRAIARAVAKFTAGTAAQVVGLEKGGMAGDLIAAAGTLWNIGNAVSEEADKRSWLTLPAEVTVGQLDIAPGPCTLDVEFVDRYGTVFERKQFEIQTKPGETVFLSYRTYL